jgi:hypothetical protein
VSLAGFIISTVTGRSAKRFDKATRDPAATQITKLMTMVTKNAGADYGRRYDFGSIRTIEDYRKRVPIITYENIREDIDRVLAGKSNVLTAEDPVMFAQTSGTTGDAKCIPVTPTCQGRDHKDTSRTWLYHVGRCHRGVYDRKIVTLVSPAIEGYAPSGVPFGSTSGHIYKNMPGIIRRAYSIPYEVFEIEDYQGKYYAIMRLALEHEVRMLCTANPSSILKMCEKANEFSEDIIRDIRDGTLSPRYRIEQNIRQALSDYLRPNSQQANALEKARSARDGVLKPVDYWPDLRTICCWKGGTVGHYIEKFWPWFDPDDRRRLPTHDWGYLSSEARGSIPVSDEGSQGVLAITANFFEFVAVDDVTAAPDDYTAWRFLTAADLEQGGEYYIFVTTSGGLYRYDINDVIQVTGMYNGTPQIVFLRKGRGMTNITGEKLSVNQVIAACEQSARETGAVPDHFKAEADTKNSRYVIRVEFAGPTAGDVRRAFLAGIDNHLKNINIEYKTKRESQRLDGPILHVMRDGWYERERKRQVESGKRAFQAKTEVLSPMKAETMAVRPELDEIVELDGEGARG